MAISRRTEKRVVKIVSITVLVICLVYCGSVAAFLALIEVNTQQDLPKIRAALDQTCGAGVVQANREGYDWEFSGFYSVQADCQVDGRGGYTCVCHTPLPSTR
jgi:hypothetical protein